MHSRVKQRHLHCFVEVVRQGTLSEAASALAITPSAMSKTLSELEDIAGERLLERSRSGIALTDAGAILHRYASASLTALNQGLDLIARNRKKARATIVVGVLRNAVGQIMPRPIAEFKRSHPKIPLKILTGTNRQLLTHLRLGEVDFVVGRLTEPAEMMGLQFESLYHERLAWVARPAHPLLNHQSLNSEAVSIYTILLPPLGTIVRLEADRFLISHGLTELPDVVETACTEFARHYVIQGDASWVASYGVVKEDVERGILQELPVDLSATNSAVGISTRTGNLMNRLALELMQHVRKTALSADQTRIL